MHLITGATGHVGSALVTRLAAAGTPARALVRREVPLPVPTVLGDLSSAASLDAALDGVDTAFLVWPLGTPDGAAEVVGRLARSVSRIVYLSSHGASEAPDADPITRMHGAVESLIAASGSRGPSCAPGASRATPWAGPTRCAAASCGGRTPTRRARWSTRTTSPRWPSSRWPTTPWSGPRRT